MKKALFIIILFLTQLTEIIAQNKNVYWLHGLNDTTTAWKHYADIFEKERRLVSFRPYYHSGNGIEKSTTQINNLITPNPQNIGIGHSMGGLVLRNLDRTNPAFSRKINGLITVASPNLGAGIANSFENNSLLAASQKACSDLGSGPASELFAIPWNITSVSGLASLGGHLSTKKLCELFIKNDELGKFAGSLAARNDLRQGSHFLQSLNSSNSNIPNLTMVVQENSPVHWRLMSSTLTRDNPNDQLLPNAVSVTREVYNGFFIARTAGTIANAILGFVNPVLFLNSAINAFKANEWKKGRDWIDDSETIWNGLTKASRLESQNYWVWSWIPCESIPSKKILIDDFVVAPNTTCGEWGFVQRTRNVMIHHPSDGFIPSYSQDLASLPPSNRYFINGANHIEVLNMSNSKLNGIKNDATKGRLDEIFRDRTDIFFTARK